MSPNLSLKPKREGDVLAAVMEYLTMRVRGFWERRNTGGAYHGTRYVKFNDAGTVDITGILWPGIPFAVETKREGWKPSNEQERRRFFLQLEWLERWCRAGGVGIVASEVREIDLWVVSAQADRTTASRAALTHLDLWRQQARR